MLYSSLGYYALLLGFVSSLPIFFFSIKNFKDKKILDYKIITFSFIQLFLVFISFLGLIFSFIYSDFSNETVFNNSHTTKPLFYKIAVPGVAMREFVIMVISFNFIYFYIFDQIKRIVKKI